MYFTVDILEGYPDKITPEEITLNAIERQPVLTTVLNPNASEASYKQKQCSYRKTKLTFFSGGFWLVGFCRGDFILEPPEIAQIKGLEIVVH